MKINIKLYQQANEKNQISENLEAAEYPWRKIKQYLLEDHWKNETALGKELKEKQLGIIDAQLNSLDNPKLPVPEKLQRLVKWLLVNTVDAQEVAQSGSSEPLTIKPALSTMLRPLLARPFISWLIEKDYVALDGWDGWKKLEQLAKLHTGPIVSSAAAKASEAASSQTSDLMVNATDYTLIEDANKIYGQCNLGELTEQIITKQWGGKVFIDYLACQNLQDRAENNHDAKLQINKYTIDAQIALLAKEKFDTVIASLQKIGKQEKLDKEFKEAAAKNADKLEQIKDIPNLADNEIYNHCRILKSFEAAAGETPRRSKKVIVGFGILALISLLLLAAIIIASHGWVIPVLSFIGYGIINSVSALFVNVLFVTLQAIAGVALAACLTEIVQPGSINNYCDKVSRLFGLAVDKTAESFAYLGRNKHAGKWRLFDKPEESIELTLEQQLAALIKHEKDSLPTQEESRRSKNKFKVKSEVGPESDSQQDEYLTTRFSDFVKDYESKAKENAEALTNGDMDNLKRSIISHSQRVYTKQSGTSEGIGKKEQIGRRLGEALSIFGLYKKVNVEGNKPTYKNRGYEFVPVQQVSSDGSIN